MPFLKTLCAAQHTLLSNGGEDELRNYRQCTKRFHKRRTPRFLAAFPEGDSPSLHGVSSSFTRLNIITAMNI